MREKLLDIAQQGVEMAEAQGVEAECFVLRDKELTIEVRNKEIETIKNADAVGVGIRVLSGSRFGFSFTTDLSYEGIKKAVTDALQVSRHASIDEFNQLVAAPLAGYPQVEAFDPKIQDFSIEEKVELARQAESYALAFDRRIRIIERAGYEDSIYEVAVVNSRGVNTYAKGSYCGLYVFLTAEEDGDMQTGFSMQVKRQVRELDPKGIGEEAASNATRILKARRVGSQYLPAILEPYVMTNFLGVLASSFGADSVQKGKSILAGRIGEEVAAPQVTLIDDGTLRQGVASFPFDGEGWPSQRTVLVEKGILQGYLYDCYTALKDNRESTGNGIRSSFRGLPSVGTTNFYLEAGQGKPVSLWKDLEKGVYIVEVMGIHTANPISGDFSVGASGLMIEKGELTYPVRGITVAGNIFSCLKDIEMVASDLRFYGSLGSPSVRVKSLSIAGE